VINDAIKLKFTVDSGASDVSIPADVVMTLVRAGTISQDDFIGDRTFTLADGSTVPSAEFRIRSLQVGSLVMRDVVASIADARGQLLLGQSFLTRLSSWSIDNQRHVLLINEAPGVASIPIQQAVSAQQASANVPVDALPSSPQMASATTQAPAAPGTNEAAAEQQVLRLIQVWSSPDDADGSAVRSFYTGQVNYYGRVVPIDQVMVDKTRFAARWPIRHYVVRPQSLSAACVTASSCTVNGILDWYAANGSTGASSQGAAEFVYNLYGGLITYESGKVLSRERPSPAPG
jgi:hypothetical protein